MKTLIVLILAVGITLFSSCEKQELPDAPGKRLKMMKLTNPGDSSTFFFTNFKYDSKNRLIAKEDSGYNGNGILLKFYFEFDSQDRLVKSTQNATDLSGIIIHTVVKTFIYNDGGKIIRTNESTPSHPFVPDYYRTFAYDSQSRVIAETYYYPDTPQISGYSKYFYDDQDNVTGVEMFTEDNILIQTRKLKYGPAINNSYQLGQYYFFGTYEYVALSKNNITEEIITGGGLRDEKYYDYQYFNNGIPKNITIRNNQNPLRQNIELYYE